ncbi:Hypothetical predicted protein [Mytilus galloprovincialis]|uniref:Ig-like domain-containing protein n=1 Tax=Mytilus galloprovincialis TaxID=29158 RepID=A0A8B6EB65_MYTGA|nr:Hypothetical predicted protein [Mytilus galloprovincialis]
MIVHLTNLKSFMDIELESVCDKKNCTGLVCDRCYYHPPDVKISIIQPVRKDDNITIICGISPLTKDTEIVWFVSNGSVSNAIHNNDKYKVNTNKSINSSLLTIYSVQYTDELNYACHATNVLQNRISSPTQLHVFECPTVNVSNNALAKAGTNITIWCEVPSSSKATGITWIKNGSIIQITNSTRYGGGTISFPSLGISDVQLVDEGMYTCQATNPIGTGNQTVLLTVFIDPIANISSNPVILGNNITISCYVHLSTKETNITWLKDDKIIQIKGNEKYDAGTFSYEIYHVQLEDEGHYTCQASSPIGIVTSQPVSLSVITYTPVVSISEIQPAAIGSNITLICNITSLTEEIDVTWFKNRVILNKSQTDTSQSIGGSVFLHTLTLNFLGVDNEGNYSCKATNKAGDGWSELVHLSLFENITQGTSIFSSYSSYSTETLESSKTAYLNSYESSVMPLSFSKIVKSLSEIPSNNLPVPTASVKHIEPTHSVQTSATTLINIHPSTTSSKLEGNRDNRSNVNAWIITTVVICIVEFIVITLVVYIVWLKRKQKFIEEMDRNRIQELEDNITLGTRSVILENGTYRGTPSFIMDNGTLRTQRSILPLYATMGRYHSPLMETDNPTSEDYLYSEINKDPRYHHHAIPNGGPRSEPIPVMEHPASEDNHYTEINKGRRDNNPVVANGVINSNHTDMSNETPKSDGKQQTETDNSISDGKQQQGNDKLCKDESPAIPNRMLPEDPSDDALNETEVTSL